MRPAEMIDFYATLAELAGLKTPSYVQGVSQVPVLRDVSARPRAAALTQYRDGYSLRTERYRYTEWGTNGAKGIELYDHQADPDELNNLAGAEEQASLKAELAAKLHSRVADATGKLNGSLQQLDVTGKRSYPQPALPGTIRGSKSAAR